MLYYPAGMSKPLRLQGAFISDREIEAVVNYIKNQSVPLEYSDDITEYVLPNDDKTAVNFDGQQTDNPAGQDELMPEALEIIMQAGQASSSLLQRRLRIGYTRAARIIDIMEDKGIIVAGTGTSKPRELLVTYEEACLIMGISRNGDLIF
jgi:S-DNA-T family DNA segregation ATPase FtsK/SpoIIIE